MNDTVDFGDPARIESLCGYARQAGVDEAVAIACYVQELERLGSEAKVRTFISLIAEKHARDAVRTWSRPRES